MIQQLAEQARQALAARFPQQTYGLVWDVAYGSDQKSIQVILFGLPRKLRQAGELIPRLPNSVAYIHHKAWPRQEWHFHLRP